MESVGCMGLYDAPLVVAAARNLYSANKGASLHDPGVPAITLAIPQACFVWPIVWLLAFNDKIAETHAHQI